ncbi:MAG: hypothetical protein CMJ83_07010 [Planctomycetes bacterium]|nr:hypothetical protein [Planctomycetota bacterium]
MKDLRRAVARDASYPRVVFFHQGTVGIGDMVFEDLWPKARAVADPERAFYCAFGRRRGSARDFLKLRTLVGLGRAMLKGNGVGRPRGGDVRTLPGVLVVLGNRVVWEHPFSGGPGDHPSFEAVADHARQAMSETPA